ncbi:MAG: hypothetical protein ACO3VD_03860 [Pseudomonadales bacterium]
MSAVAAGGGGRGGGKAAEAEHGHASKNPGGPPPPHVGAVAQPGSQQLNGVVQGHERPGNHGG